MAKRGRYGTIGVAGLDGHRHCTLHTQSVEHEAILSVIHERVPSALLTSPSPNP